MNLDRKSKTMSFWPTLLDKKIASQKSGREYAFSNQLSLTAYGMLVQYLKPMTDER